MRRSGKRAAGVEVAPAAPTKIDSLDLRAVSSAPPEGDCYIVVPDGRRMLRSEWDVIDRMESDG